MKAKYKCGAEAVPKVQATHNCSSTWRAIVSVWDKVIEGMQWNIGNGRTVRFWSDNWLPSGILLQDVVTQQIDSALASKPVDHFSDGNGNWQLQRVLHLIPESIV
ncbi:putative ribonuclease H protein, partial [Trifolium medium]|nr:putative ribonuclease H protein [Trifolium medium]